MTYASPGPISDLGPVVVAHVHTARRDHSLVMDLTALGTGDRLDALRPPPTLLQRHPRGFHRAEVDVTTPAMVSPNLIDGAPNWSTKDAYL
jgi:hypothetical protein